MKDAPDILSEEAKERVHAAKNAAQADELARLAQAAETAKTAAHTAADLAAVKVAEKIIDRDEMEGLILKAIGKNDERMMVVFRESLMSIFGAPDKMTQDQMHILMPKIPLLCLTVENQGKSLSEIKDDIKWATRLILGAVILAALGVIIAR